MGHQCKRHKNYVIAAYPPQKRGVGTSALKSKRARA
jgi:hypothetical protein